MKLWGEEKQKYPLSHGAFTRCHDRVRDGKVTEISWPRTPEGFNAFRKEIGPWPKDMKKPSIGRIDHNKGYIAGNIRWEEYAINSVKRKGTRYENETFIEYNPIVNVPKFKKGTLEHYEHQKQASIARWSKPESHEKMSKRMMGNTYARRV
jgi:hypothetical protein